MRSRQKSALTLSHPGTPYLLFMSAPGCALPLSYGASSAARVARKTGARSKAAEKAGAGTKSSCGSNARLFVRIGGWSFFDTSS
jgi:hypothetical protein